MSSEILTQNDLLRFRHELIQELENLLAADIKDSQKRWIRSKEVLQYLKISPTTLQNYRANGTIPYSRFGKAIYYLFDDIQKVLDANKKS